ncbi:hypothetical protein ACOSQ4_005286 [Xanthoceras sorbifolium]
MSLQLHECFSCNRLRLSKPQMKKNRMKSLSIGYNNIFVLHERIGNKDQSQI